MGQVLIRNLSDQAIAAHRARAKAAGRSLEQELRDLIENSAPLRPLERLALAEFYQAMTPDIPQADPVDLLREDRSR